LLEAAVTAASSHALQCEPLRVPPQPLDVLCQQLVGMAAARPWRANDTFELVKRAYPFRDLSRAGFDACLAYLAGADGGPARLRQNGKLWSVRNKGTAALLRRNVGSIIAEESRRVVVEEDNANAERRLIASRLIGEVDMAFGEGLQSGDRFLLDGRCLEFRRREAEALLVEEVWGRPAAPHWSGDGWPLAPELARRLYLARVQAAEALREGRAVFVAMVSDEFGLDEAEIDSLASHFEQQERASEIPDQRTLLIECVRRDHGIEHYMHTPLNRAGNDALARLAVLRLARYHGRSSLSLVSELGFMLVARGERGIEPDQWRIILAADRMADDLEEALAGSELLTEQFRRVAQTSLFWPRNPIWPERRPFIPPAHRDFVLMRQATSELLAERESARAFLEQLPQMTIRCRTLAEISPFVEGWNRVEAGPIDTNPMRQQGLLANASG
jgi:ATP-dependent Lhr-like helicase